MSKEDNTNGKVIKPFPKRGERGAVINSLPPKIPTSNNGDSERTNKINESSQNDKK